MKLKATLKRYGPAGLFCFFLIKGLAWLILPAVAAATIAN